MGQCIYSTKVIDGKRYLVETYFSAPYRLRYAVDEYGNVVVRRWITNPHTDTIKNKSHIRKFFSNVANLFSKFCEYIRK